MNQSKALKQLKELKKYSLNPRLSAEGWDKDWKTLIATLMSARTKDDKTIPVAETEDELLTPLWQDFYLVNGKEILKVNPKYCLMEYSEKKGYRYKILDKWYKKEEIESIDSQMPQPSHELNLRMVCGIREVLLRNDVCED